MEGDGEAACVDDAPPQAEVDDALDEGGHVGGAKCLLLKRPEELTFARGLRPAEVDEDRKVLLCRWSRAIRLDQVPSRTHADIQRGRLTCRSMWK